MERGEVNNQLEGEKYPERIGNLRGYCEASREFAKL
jgi:hypothetical protein